MTLPAPTPLTYGGGGGGGGGLSAEADEVLFIDSGNSDQLFLRRYRKGTTGVQTAVNDFELDGSTAYAAVGPVSAVGDWSDFPGVTRLANTVVMLDQGNDDEAFLRVQRFGPTGVPSGFASDYEFDGFTAYVAVGPVVPSGIQPIGVGANGLYNVTYQRLTNAAVSIAPGALSIQYVVIADGVTVEGVAVPAGVAITHEVTGGVAGGLDFVADASGDVLIAIESAA